MQLKRGGRGEKANGIAEARCKNTSFDRSAAERKEGDAAAEDREVRTRIARENGRRKGWNDRSEEWPARR